MVTQRSPQLYHNAQETAEADAAAQGAVQEEKVFVGVRVRPEIDSENSSQLSWDWDGEHGTISSCEINWSKLTPQEQLKVPDTRNTNYQFEKLFEPSSSNETVYNHLVSHLVERVVEGYNATVLAYGQTTSGKTHTITGNPNDKGILQRSLDDLFRFTKKECFGSTHRFAIRVAYCEIYQEAIRDLVEPSNKNLNIIDDPLWGPLVRGLSEHEAGCVEEALAVLEKGEKNRHVGKTGMSAQSSRSHTIFRVRVESKPLLGDFEFGSVCDNITDKENRNALNQQPSPENTSKAKDFFASAQEETLARDTQIDVQQWAADQAKPLAVSSLNIIDLAGSERVSKTRAQGQRLKEAGRINRSLSALGNVIAAINEGNTHIPFRDSKLTRLLTAALGGNSCTSMICCISPALIHRDESRSTLQFAHRASNINTRARINQLEAGDVILKAFKLHVLKLQRQLAMNLNEKATLQGRVGQLEAKLAQSLASTFKTPRFVRNKRSIRSTVKSRRMPISTPSPLSLPQNTLAVPQNNLMLSKTVEQFSTPVAVTTSAYDKISAKLEEKDRQLMSARRHLGSAQKKLRQFLRVSNTNSTNFKVLLSRCIQGKAMAVTVLGVQLADMNNEMSLLQTELKELRHTEVENKRLQTTTRGELAEAKLAIREAEAKVSTLERHLTTLKTEQSNKSNQLSQQCSDLEGTLAKERSMYKSEQNAYKQKIEHLIGENSEHSAQLQELRNAMRRLHNSNTELLEKNDQARACLLMHEQDADGKIEEQREKVRMGEELVNHLRAKLEDSTRLLSNREKQITELCEDRDTLQREILVLDSLESTKADCKRFQEKVDSDAQALQNERKAFQAERVRLLKLAETNETLQVSKSAYTALEKQLQDVVDERDELHKQLVMFGSIEKSNAQILRRREELEQDVLAAKLRNGELEEKMSFTNLELESTRKDLETSHKECAKLKEKLELVEAKLSSGLKRERDLEFQAEVAQAERKVELESLSQLELSLKRIRKEKAEIQEKFLESERDKQGMLVETSNLKDHLARITEQLKSAQHAELAKEREALQTRTSFDTNLRTLQGNLESKCEEVYELKAQIDVLKQERKTSMAEISSLRTKNTAFRRERDNFSQLGTEYEQTKALVNDLRKEKEQLVSSAISRERILNVEIGKRFAVKIKALEETCLKLERKATLSSIVGTFSDRYTGQLLRKLFFQKLFNETGLVRKKELEMEVSQLKNDNVRLIAENRKLAEVKSDLRRALDCQNGELTDAREYGSNAEYKSSKFLLENQALRKGIESIKNILTEKDLALQDIKLELAHAADKGACLLSERSQYKLSLDISQRDLAESIQRCSELRAELETFTVDLNKVRATKEQVEAENTEKQLKLNNLTRKVDRALVSLSSLVNLEHNDLDMAVKATQDLIRQQNHKIRMQQNSIKHQQDNVHMLRTKYGELEALFDSLSKQKRETGLEMELERTRSSLSSANQSIDQLRSKVLDIGASLREKEETIRSLEDELSECHSKVSVSRTENSVLISRLQHINSRPQISDLVTPIRNSGNSHSFSSVNDDDSILGNLTPNSNGATFHLLEEMRVSASQQIDSLKAGNEKLRCAFEEKERQLNQAVSLFEDTEADFKLLLQLVEKCSSNNTKYGRDMVQVRCKMQRILKWQRSRKQKNKAAQRELSSEK